MYQDQDPNPRKAEPRSSSCFSQALGGPSKWAALQGLGRFFFGLGVVGDGKPPMTGNGNHTSYKNGDGWGMVVVLATSRYIWMVNYWYIYIYIYIYVYISLSRSLSLSLSLPGADVRPKFHWGFSYVVICSGYFSDCFRVCLGLVLIFFRVCLFFFPI